VQLLSVQKIPKAQKIMPTSLSFFALLGSSARLKALRKMLMKLTPGESVAD